ncbi:hypothetical protein K435DRAFT_824799 [Dendrothele bispora CBS 962.96]|uniref:Uncharacterized protein n=1 Tax=Dendrothele bispora (strain CBS 962.96) TaxID=1314807 RepID=A0A4V4HIW7_DENBC|nr:hypothetical protein K435DRAFT_824799 [Dendrothele bispora CBS 962.96]
MAEPTSTSNSTWMLSDDDDDYPNVDRHSCQLLGPTALIVQGLMGILVILSLLYKRHRESPKRPWKIWLFDVSKQVVGQMFVHGVNVLISDLVSHIDSSNACVSYFLNILADTTLGVALLYVILQVLTYVLSEKFHLQGFESGIYGDPPSIAYWGRQAVIYVVALTTMKFMVIGLLYLFPGLFTIAEWLLSWTWTSEGGGMQVIFVMGIFPIIMNILQFWIIDTIVKASGPPVALDAESPSRFEHDREPLFNAPSDDEDDDHSYPQRHDIENPPPRRRSDSIDNSTRSRSPDKTISGTGTPYDFKSTGSSSPAQNQDAHSYPPSLSSSLTSTNSILSSSSSASAPIREAKKLNKKKRGPPSPLNIHPVGQPAVNSPQVTGNKLQPTPQATKPVQPQPVKPTASDDWADSWEDSDDWANRVGEEEWTGRRMEAKKDNLHDVWGQDSTTVGS